MDIFFVISGFLITGHLMREVAQSGRLNLPRFYARRIRRLLPAALLVLAVSVGLTYWLIPRVLWAQYLSEVIASTFYAENWILVANSVDYLASENLPSLAQHYWSLSVEEQFYLVWPLLILAAFGVARRRGRSGRLGVRYVLLALLAASLLSSIVTTYAGPPGQAYFATYTRAWQFAAGGLLAIAAPRMHTVGKGRSILALTGWAMLAVTIFTYSARTPFPGFAAVLPVAGAVVVIATGPGLGDFRSTPWVNWAWVRELGASSYSLYLWHWPLVIVLPYLLPEGPEGRASAAAKLVLLGVTVLLAGLSRRWVEDPIRNHRWLANRNMRTFTVALIGMVLVVCTAVPGSIITAQAAAQSTADADELISSGAVCFGAAAPFAKHQPCSNPALQGVLLPAPAARLADTGGAYRCYESEPSSALPNCTIGSSRSDALRVAITGDSHAASLIPALEPMLISHNWKLDIFVGRGCVWMAAQDSACESWRRSLRARFNDGPAYDLIIVAATHHNLTAAASAARPRQLAEEWSTAIQRGTLIAAVADNPAVPPSAFDCIERARDYDSAVRCSFPQAEGWAVPDPMRGAVRLAGKGAHLIDLTGAYCQQGICPMVVGHVIVYRDTHHITATFAKTLGPLLVDRISAFVGR